MSDIIRRWILSQIGIVLEPEWAISNASSVLARLLRRFDLLPEDQLKIFENEGENYESVLEYIRHTINGLKISLSKEDFQSILRGNEMLTTKLFYELYLALNDKTDVHFVVERQLNNEVEDTKRFQVAKCDEPVQTSIKFGNTLSEPLAERKDVIMWNKEKLEHLTNQCRESRQKYVNYLKEKEEKIELNKKEDIFREMEKEKPKLCTSVETVNYTIDELILQEKKGRTMVPLVPDPKISEKIISNIKEKKKKFETKKGLKEQFQKLLLKDLWDKVFNEQEEQFKGELSKIMMKQSVFEQQMSTKLFEVRQQKDIMTANRLKLVKIINQEQENQFKAALMKKERDGELERLLYYIEKDQNLELHERLYAEKIKRKMQENYNVCNETLATLVDMAFYKASFAEMFDEEIPKDKWNELSKLFLKGLPIFDLVEDLSEIIDYDPIKNEFDPEAEEIFHKEIDRQNCLDDLEYEAYVNFFWPWELHESFNFDQEAINLGMNVIGYIVHRLLLAKYPVQHIISNPLVQRMEVAVCVNGLQNLKYLPALQRLLNSRKIKIIQIEDVINYCINIFKEESNPDYISNVFEEETVKDLDKEKVKKDQKNINKKGAKDVPNKGKKENLVVSEIKFEEKQIQTPKFFPCEELVLSPAGELGRYAFEILNLGESINDELMSSMFVEYLLSLKDVEGFALINYPQTIYQVKKLEEALTGFQVPIDTSDIPNESIFDIMDLEESDLKQNLPKEDRNASKRFSKLVKNPKPEEIPYYETYLTAYIEMRSMEGDDIDELYYDCFKTVESDNELNNFYKSQGCKYTLTYKEIDFPTIKHLGKLIIGDYTLPPKTSIELFTDTVHYIEKELNEKNAQNTAASEKVGKKKEKPPEKKAVSAKTETKIETKTETKSKPGKASKEGSSKKSDKKEPEVLAVIEKEDKETQIPEPIPTPPEEEPPPTPIPGALNWIYVECSLPQYLEQALATIWENMEKSYLNDIKQLLFRKRILHNTLIPFNKTMYKNLQEFMARPDDKQSYINQFQIIFNEMDDDMREDEEVKAELHCRINEFCEKLWKICDLRMNENEEERKRIIRYNWHAEFLYELTNIYITLCQLEVDRCADSMQLLIDYYTGMVTKMPTTERPLPKMQVTLITLNNYDEECSYEIDTKFLPYTNYVEEVLKNAEIKNIEESPYHNSLNNNVNNCLNKIDSYMMSAEQCLKNLTNFFNPKNIAKSGKQEKKGKKDNINFEPEQDVKDRSEELLAEFLCAFTGEGNRANMRIQLIQYVYYQDFANVLETATKTFHSLHDDIANRYQREIFSVDNACSVFARAVEAESKILPELKLEDDKFFIKLDSFMYEGPLPDYSPILSEPSADEKFSIEQLHLIIDILFNLAPYGQISERAFTFLLQDLLIHNAEDGKPKYVPKLWAKLHPYRLNNLTKEIFCESEYIDWKDFIIYNLYVPFPTEAELLDVRIQFQNLDPDITELIYDFQFNEIKFWFEDLFDISKPEMKLKLKLIRDILLRLYKIDENRFNYSALLLAFCKDENPILGFVKALELSIGKYICWKIEDAIKFYNKEMIKVNEEKLAEMEAKIYHKDAILNAEEITTELIDRSVHRCTSAYIEEVEEESSLYEGYTSSPTSYEEIISSHPSQNLDLEYQYLMELANTTNFGESESKSSIFTNLSQGFETVDNMVYKMNFDVLINIVTVSVPWHAKVQCMDGSTIRERIALIFQSKIHPDLKYVFTHVLLNDPDFIEVINKIYKFRVKDIIAIIRSLF